MSASHWLDHDINVVAARLIYLSSFLFTPTLFRVEQHGMGRYRSLLLAPADLHHFYSNFGAKIYNLTISKTIIQFFAPLTADYSRQMTRFYVIGYLVPGVLVLIWAAIKINNGDNNQCWHSDNVVDSVELIWKGPRLGMNMFNFTIFASTLKALISVKGLTFFYYKLVQDHTVNPNSSFQQNWLRLNQLGQGNIIFDPTIWFAWNSWCSKDADECEFGWAKNMHWIWV